MFFFQSPWKNAAEANFHKKSFVKSSQHPANLKPAQEILNNECKGCVGLERDLLTRSWLQQNDDAARYDNADF